MPLPAEGSPAAPLQNEVAGRARGGSPRPVLASPEWAAPFLIRAFLGRVVVASRGDARLRHRAQPPHRLRHPERLRPARPDGTAAGPRARRRQEQPRHCPCRLPAPRPLHRCGGGVLGTTGSPCGCTGSREGMCGGPGSPLRRREGGDEGADLGCVGGCSEADAGVRHSVRARGAA